MPWAFLPKNSRKRCVFVFTAVVKRETSWMALLLESGSCMNRRVLKFLSAPMTCWEQLTIST